MTTLDKQAIDEWSVARAVSNLAPFLPQEGAGQMMQRIRQFVDESARVRALIGIASAFSESQADELRQEAFSTAREIENPWLRCRALIGVAYRVPDYKIEALTLAIAAVEQMPSDYHRARALSGMAGLLPDELVNKALELLRSVRDEALRTYYLAFFGHHLALDDRLELLRTLTALPGDIMQLQAVLALTGELPSQTMEVVLEYARGLTQPEVQAYALASLAPKFPQDQEAIMQSALSAALQVSNPYDRTELLGQFASAIPESDRNTLIQKEMSAIRQSGDVLPQVYGLQALIPCLAEEDQLAVVHEIIQTARTIEDKGLRIEVLASMVKDLPEAERLELVSDVLTDLKPLLE